MWDPQITIEEINDPAAVARHKAQDERASRNSTWLQAHWPDLLPQAVGKFLAVAGQEAFLADTPEEAWTKARAAHLEDDGVLCQYVLPPGVRPIYANPWRMVRVSGWDHAPGDTCLADQPNRPGGEGTVPG